VLDAVGADNILAREGLEGALLRVLLATLDDAVLDEKVVAMLDAGATNHRAISTVEH